MYQTKIILSTKFVTRTYAFDNHSYHIAYKGYESLDKFCVRISGESMIQAGICPGDIVEVAKNLTPFHNDIVLAKIDGIHTIKRLYINEDQSYTLFPENIDFEPIEISSMMDFVIEGVVTRVVKDN
jgi:SOS-response transcriptional repressor LexA